MSNCGCNCSCGGPKRVAKFEKVSFEQFKEDFINDLPEFYKNDEDLKEIYDNIKLPKRGTKDSAGYDFFSPIRFIVRTDDGIVIPTGIRCIIAQGWVLKTYPRSGQGFKFGAYEYNSVGIIDGDYAYAKNEGPIKIKLAARKNGLIIEAGMGFCQGIFVEYGITEDDEVTEIRTGGFGSTTKVNN